MSRIPLSPDEWLLCLDMYLRHRSEKSLPTPRSHVMRELSETLRNIRKTLYVDETFRPPRGVDRRVREFWYLDPEKTRESIRVAEGAKKVWEEWSKKPKAVAQLAQAIRACLPAEEMKQASKVADPEYGYEVNESKILTRVHAVRERDDRLVRLKKESFQDTHKGRLYCETCRFDFARSYPRHGEGFMECHHIKSLSELEAGQKTTLDDLALLCANCHRMIHYRRPWLSMARLRTLVYAGAR